MLKIGILGMSPGNAHPSSWSAIINGCFNGTEISRLGYPAVTEYLEANKDTLGIPNARVTHVWSQDSKLSEQIAATAGIDNIAKTPEAMIGQVDAVILARDDAENHKSMAKLFVDAGIPLFIDKPLCTSHKDLDYFSEKIEQGSLIMSCSSMRYAPECRSAKAELTSLGQLELVTSVGKKDWLKYGVHMLEAVFTLLDDPKPIKVTNIGKEGRDIVCIEFANGQQAVFHLFMEITATFQVSLFGSKGWKLVDMTDSYFSFRTTIIEFIRSVEEGRPRIAFYKTRQIISALIAGAESLKQQGTTINL